MAVRIRERMRKIRARRYSSSTPERIAPMERYSRLLYAMLRLRLSEHFSGCGGFHVARHGRGCDTELIRPFRR